MRSFALVLCLSLLCIGCGIPEAVSDECGPYRRAYDTLSKKRIGLLARGVEKDAPILRNTEVQLAQARAGVIQCTGQSS